MSIRDLQRFFDTRKGDADGLVLATVYDTLGSTYSKAGDRMLIAGNGDFQGMLSGGCLEGDLAERAMQVARSGVAQTVTYDLRESDEELWGLGVGCEGLMRIFLQALVADGGYEPFASLSACLLGDTPGLALTVIDSGVPELSAGAALVGRPGQWSAVGIPERYEAALHAAAENVQSANDSYRESIDINGETADLIVAALRPARRILVLGGGLDAEPVVRLCSELGWRVFVQDHRPAYIESGDFSTAEAVSCVPAETLAENLDLTNFDAAVCMSHHLVSDRVYLRQLAATEMCYVGLLGPANRRDRLMSDLENEAAALQGRLHGPAGIDIGGRGPASIALSIVAQMHQVLGDN